MKELIVSDNETGQRLDRLLGKYLRDAPKSFLYRMLRKKNITLNGKKAQGNEMLRPGDQIRLFLSEETIEKFRGAAGCPQPDPAKTPDLSIIYEDEHILLVNKPAGMLSQKAGPGDVSLNEHLLRYLLDKGTLREEELSTFRPSVCNRLDRNTSGLVIFGKSLEGLQTMNRLLKERSLKKYYRCIVRGPMTGSEHLEGYLIKNERTNRVFVSRSPRSDQDKHIETQYTALSSAGDITMLEVHLITGRSHQIRAHLASIGHPIIGDGKYGDEETNRRYRRLYGVQAQLLHAYRMEFPMQMDSLPWLSGRSFCAQLPPAWEKIMNQKRSASYGNLEYPRSARLHTRRAAEPHK